MLGRGPVTRWRNVWGAHGWHPMKVWPLWLEAPRSLAYHCKTPIIELQKPRRDTP